MIRCLLCLCWISVAGLSQAGSLTDDHTHEHRDDTGHLHHDSGTRDARLAEARRLQQGHDFEGAAKILAGLLEQDPFNLEAQLLHADVLRHDGRIEESRLACIRVAMSGAQTLAGYCAIQALTAAGEHQRAYAAAKALSPESLSVQAQVWALEISADAAWKAGKIAAAREWFEKAMAFKDVPHSTEDAYLAFLQATS